MSEDTALRIATQAAWALQVFTDALKRNNTKRATWEQKVRAMEQALAAAEEFDNTITTSEKKI